MKKIHTYKFKTISIILAVILFLGLILSVVTISLMENIKLENKIKSKIEILEEFYSKSNDLQYSQINEYNAKLDAMKLLDLKQYEKIICSIYNGKEMEKKEIEEEIIDRLKNIKMYIYELEKHTNSNYNIEVEDGDKIRINDNELNNLAELKNSYILKNDLEYLYKNMEETVYMLSIVPYYIDIEEKLSYENYILEPKINLESDII